jgi:hypothetical protein
MSDVAIKTYEHEIDDEPRYVACSYCQGRGKFAVCVAEYCVDFPVCTVCAGEGSIIRYGRIQRGED